MWPVLVNDVHKMLICEAFHWVMVENVNAVEVIFFNSGIQEIIRSGRKSWITFIEPNTKVKVMNFPVVQQQILVARIEEILAEI